MKLLWYISVLFVLFSILLHNPKRGGNSGVFSDKTQLLTPTRSTQKSLQVLIATSISFFFLFTIVLVISL